ncbi:MAG: hypothetical protein R3F31_27250 [Verrucomicrobiales bacterium]
MVNRKILESLIKAGAFDWTGERRDTLFSRVDQVIAGSSAAHRDRAFRADGRWTCDGFGQSHPRPKPGGGQVEKVRE